MNHNLSRKEKIEQCLINIDNLLSTEFMNKNLINKILVNIPTGGFEIQHKIAQLVALHMDNAPETKRIMLNRLLIDFLTRNLV